MKMGIQSRIYAQDGSLDSRLRGNDEWALCIVIITCDRNPQILPRRIVLFNQRKLPGTIPFLKLLLPQNSLLHRAVQFKIHQPRDTIFFRKPCHQTITVLPNALHQVTSDTNVESAIPFASQDVDGRLFGHEALG